MMMVSKDNHYMTDYFTFDIHANTRHYHNSLRHLLTVLNFFFSVVIISYSSGMHDERFI